MQKKQGLKGLLAQRNSIFVRILVPTIVVMLAQIVLIVMVLMASGTLETMRQNAEQSLRRDAENRSITLENMMVHSWSNISTLQTDMENAISHYLDTKHLSVDAVFGQDAHEREILIDSAERLMSALRVTSATGVFVYFIEPQDAEGEAAELNGLFFRDFNPNMNSTDFSDILLEKGPAEAARRNSIQLSSLWRESYGLSQTHPAVWDALMAAYKAAQDYPGLAATDLAFWSEVHCWEPDSRLDSNPCITYVRPLYYQGHLIGVMGTEVQIDHLKRYFPSSDLGDLGGYMLLQMDSLDEPTQACRVSAITGSYMKRLTDEGGQITLQPKSSNNMYRVIEESFVPTSAALQPLKLYNSNAPFSGQQWALAALEPDEVLFASLNQIQTGIIQGSLIALILGFALIFVSIRLTTRPLLSIAGQLEHSSALEPVVVPNSNIYEINLLCGTINEMKRKRMDVETALREDRERYMLALESAIDTFIEYSPATDELELFYFAATGRSSTLTMKTLQHFSEEAQCSQLCHPADAWEFLAALRGEGSGACEVRFRAAMFPEVSSPTDEGYFWMSFKAVRITEDNGLAEKTIGSTTDVTQQKLEEYARLEASYHDATTGLYTREYGEILLSRLCDVAIQRQTSCCLLVLSVDSFKQFEAYYGRVFSAVLLRELGQGLGTLLPDVRDIVRWRNDKFVVFCYEDSVERFFDALQPLCARIYAGENSELSLSLSVGAAWCDGGADWDTQLDKAFAAARYVRENALGVMRFYEERTMADHLDRSSSWAVAPGVALDLSPEGIVGFTLSLFEHTGDVRSVTKMLLRLLGKLFALEQVILCEYDQDFGSNQVTFQWCAPHAEEVHQRMEITGYADLQALNAQLNESGILLYDSDEADSFSPGLRRLLCVPAEREFSALCCVMYENGAQMGRMLFLSSEKTRRMSNAEIFSLYEISKIVSTIFSLQKSNSASRAKSEFLSKMSHEIRTPMNAIIGMTKIAKEAGADREQVDTALEKIDFSAKHLLALINDILDMSRIESGKMQIDKRPFSLSELVFSIDALMRPQMEAKGLRFVIEKTLPRAQVLGDEQKIRQVLLNLLSNACKFTPEGGQVLLCLTQAVAEDGASCHCRFSVRDTGVGISEEDRFTVFNAFEQSSSGNLAAGSPKGTGLGLAISTSFIGAMGSRIELDTALGQGSEFFFTLELDCDSRQDGRAEEAAASPQHIENRFAGKRVLIVDDNDINLEIAVYLVEGLGFISETAVNGQEAVDKFLASTPGYFDIIFMDISMPVMDGLTATREIRRSTAHAQARAIPIIAMTANAFSEDTKKSIESGMNAHVAKPIEPVYLYETLEKIFAQT